MEFEVQKKCGKVSQFYQNKIKVGSSLKDADLLINEAERKIVKPLKTLSSQKLKLTAVKSLRPDLTLVFDLLAFKMGPIGFILDQFYVANFPICGDFSKISVSISNRHWVERKKSK